MKKPRITTERVKNPNARTGAALQFKVNDEERTKIEAKAGKWAGGNLSAFCREAALKWEPEDK